MSIAEPAAAESLEDLEARQIDPTKPLLEVDRLVMHYKIKAGEVSAVEDVSFTVHEGEAVGLVGESGCGKTSIALSLLRLLPSNAEFISGEIRLNGEDLLYLSPEEMRQRRWKDIAMVFQGAMNSWNPVYRVGDQIRETLDTHYRGVMSYDEQRAHMEKLFSSVGLPPTMLDRYPHEFSGGMRQRAVIAMALACSPQLIIADEPTTALDVIVQDQILKELKRIQAEMGMSIIYISHDIAVIAEVTDSLGVMYAGKLVEYGPTAQIFARPRHPYAYLLLRSTPSITGPRRQAGAAGGRAAGPLPTADRLPLPPALPVRDGGLLDGRAAARPISAAATASPAGTTTRSRSSRKPCSDDDVEHGPRGASEAVREATAPRDHGPRDAIPDLARALPRADGLRPRRRRHQLPDRARREPRPGRGVRLRQVDDGPDAREADRADRRQHLVPRRRVRARRRHGEGQGGQGVPPPGADDLPGPVRVDEPAPHDLRHRQRADDGPEGRVDARARGTSPRPAAPRRPGAGRRTSSSDTRTSSRVASASAWRSPARWS